MRNTICMAMKDSRGVRQARNAGNLKGKFHGLRISPLMVEQLRHEAKRLGVGHATLAERGTGRMAEATCRREGR